MDAGGVGTGSGLGETEGADDFAGGQAAKVTFLLSLGAVGKERKLDGGIGYAEGCGHGGVNLGDFFEHEDVGDGVQAGAAHSSGMSMPQQPSSPSLRMASRGKWSVRSQALTWGRTSVFMKSRTVSRIRSWSSVREKSMTGGKFSMRDWSGKTGGVVRLDAESDRREIPRHEDYARLWFWITQDAEVGIIHRKKKLVALDRKTPPFLQTAQKGWATLKFMGEVA